MSRGHKTPRRHTAAAPSTAAVGCATLPVPAARGALPHRAVAAANRIADAVAAAAAAAAAAAVPLPILHVSSSAHSGHSGTGSQPTWHLRAERDAATPTVPTAYPPPDCSSWHGHRAEHLKSQGEAATPSHGGTTVPMVPRRALEDPGRGCHWNPPHPINSQLALESHGGAGRGCHRTPPHHLSHKQLVPELRAGGGTHPHCGSLPSPTAGRGMRCWLLVQPSLTARHPEGMRQPMGVGVTASSHMETTPQTGLPSRCCALQPRHSNATVQPAAAAAARGPPPPPNDARPGARPGRTAAAARRNRAPSARCHRQGSDRGLLSSLLLLPLVAPHPPPLPGLPHTPWPHRCLSLAAAATARWLSSVPPLLLLLLPPVGPPPLLPGLSYALAAPLQQPGSGGHRALAAVGQGSPEGEAGGGCQGLAAAAGGGAPEGEPEPLLGGGGERWRRRVGGGGGAPDGEPEPLLWVGLGGGLASTRLTACVGVGGWK